MYSVPEVDEVVTVAKQLMPTCIMTAPKNHRPGSYLETVEDNLLSR